MPHLMSASWKFSWRDFLISQHLPVTTSYTLSHRPGQVKTERPRYLTSLVSWLDMRFLQTPRYFYIQPGQALASNIFQNWSQLSQLSQMFLKFYIYIFRMRQTLLPFLFQLSINYISLLKISQATLCLIAIRFYRVYNLQFIFLKLSKITIFNKRSLNTY